LLVSQHALAVLHVESLFAKHHPRALEEDNELINAGFAYVAERDSVKIYRKRK
jgi:hypothetical protein